MRVEVITGSRSWNDRASIAHVLRGAEALVVGDATGADTIALELALAGDVICFVFAASRTRAEVIARRARGAGKAIHIDVVADWVKDGVGAGPLRNDAIAREARRLRAADFDVQCRAFPLATSVGTYDCIRRLQRAGFVVDVRAASAAH